MIRNISVGKYLPGDSVIHKLDPRTKLFILFSMTLIIFCTRNIYALLFVLLSCILMMIFTNISLSKFIKNNKTLLFISIVTSIMNLMFEAESKFITQGKFYISEKSLKISGIMFIKFLSLMITTSSVMFTTSPGELAYAVEKILIPFEFLGLNSRDIGLTITITLKFIPTVFEETVKIINAQRSRGVTFKNKNIFKSLKNLLSIVAPLLISSIRRANFLAMALESRCYDSSKPHTSFKSYKFKLNDFVVTLITVIFIIGVIGCSLWIKT